MSGVGGAFVRILAVLAVSRDSTIYNFVQSIHQMKLIADEYKAQM